MITPKEARKRQAEALRKRDELAARVAEIARPALEAAIEQVVLKECDKGHGLAHIDHILAREFFENKTPYPEGTSSGMIFDACCVLLRNAGYRVTDDTLISSAIFSWDQAEATG